MGPLSSTYSPMTFMILPKVSGPTGILIGAPESRTSWPLTKPSVPSMAVVLAVLSPKCWATSKTSLVSVPCTSRAFRMGGSPSSNWTSPTTPVTATVPSGGACLWRGRYLSSVVSGRLEWLPVRTRLGVAALKG